uniref:Ig-like domain-containing protein n=1 Tax=Cyanoderma ruficeps TaxID=181631 RepID=A0A8C3NUT6_9PASS
PGSPAGVGPTQHVGLPGIPVVSVFPALPPVLGQPNVLVCLVENIFPPALDISWTSSGAAVAAGVTTGPFVPAADLTFVRLSRLSVRDFPWIFWDFLCEFWAILG